MFRQTFLVELCPRILLPELEVQFTLEASRVVPLSKLGQVHTWTHQCCPDTSQTGFTTVALHVAFLRTPRGIHTGGVTHCFRPNTCQWMPLCRTRRNVGLVWNSVGQASCCLHIEWVGSCLQQNGSKEKTVAAMQDSLNATGMQIQDPINVNQTTKAHHPFVFTDETWILLTCFTQTTMHLVQRLCDFLTLHRLERTTASTRCLLWGRNARRVWCEPTPRTIRCEPGTANNHKQTSESSEGRFLPITQT